MGWITNFQKLVTYVREGRRSSGFLTRSPSSRHLWCCDSTNLLKVEPWSDHFTVQNAFNSSTCLSMKSNPSPDLHSSLPHVTSVYFSNVIFYYFLSHPPTFFPPLCTDFSSVLFFVLAKHILVCLRQGLVM